MAGVGRGAGRDLSDLDDGVRARASARGTPPPLRLQLVCIRVPGAGDLAGVGLGPVACSDLSGTLGERVDEPHRPGRRPGGLVEGVVYPIGGPLPAVVEAGVLSVVVTVRPVWAIEGELAAHLGGVAPHGASTGPVGDGGVLPDVTRRLCWHGAPPR